MQTRITIEQLTTALAKHERDQSSIHSRFKSMIHYITGGAVYVAKLQEFVKRIQEKRKAVATESKEDQNSLTLAEIVELRLILLFSDADKSEPLYKNLLDILNTTKWAQFFEEHNGQWLLDNSIFSQEQFKTVENLSLIPEWLVYQGSNNLRTVFEILSKLNLLTEERFQQILKSLPKFELPFKDSSTNYLMSLFSWIDSRGQDEARMIIENMDFANVCKNARCIVSLPFIKTLTDEQGKNNIVIDIPVKNFLQILNQAEFAENLDQAFREINPTDENRKLFCKLCEAPKHALDVTHSLEKVRQSDWKSAGTTYQEVCELVLNHPEHAVAMCDTFDALQLQKKKDRYGILLNDLDPGAYPNLFMPAVFKAIKARPDLAKTLGESVIKVHNIPQKRRSSAGYGFDSGLAFDYLDLLCNNPQYASQLATGLELQYKDKMVLPSDKHLREYPEKAIPLTRILVALGSFRGREFWDTHYDQIVKCKFIETIADLIEKLKSMDALRVPIVKFLLDKEQYANIIHNRLLQISDSCRREKREFHLAVDTLKNILRYFIFVDGIEKSKQSTVHRLFGHHKDSNGAVVSNHPIYDDNAANLIGRFLIS